MDGLSLETNLEDLAKGQRVDVVFTIVQSSPGGTVCCSAIYNQVFFTDYKFPTEYGRFAFLQAFHDQKGTKHWLHCDDTTVVVPHQEPKLQSFPGIIEACAGIGAMGRRYEACGMQTTCFVDNNQQFCRWLRIHKASPVIEGDIAEAGTVAQVAKCVKGDHLLSGGCFVPAFFRLRRQKRAA